MKHIFYALDIHKPTYLDIGAHHPCFLSNTYLFYKEGSTGVLIEPDPYLFKSLTKRRRDIRLNVGVSTEDKEELMDFFVMTSKTLNTFNREEAEKIQRETNCRIEKVIQLPLIGINTVLRKYFSTGLDLLSIDVEGLDLPIVRAIDFAIVRPTVVCVETITYSEKRDGRKIPEINDCMMANGYFVYGETFINTIFVDKQKWKNGN
jgi:FkbM family methyltransferase